MKTQFKNADNVDMKWYIIDAANKPLGRVATQAATVLRGKHKPEYTPNADTGDYVIIINSDKAVLTGNKLTQKKLYRHSGHPGNQKEERYVDIMKNKSDLAMKKAVKGMLSKNKLRKVMMNKLHVYKYENHKHQAQNPVMYTPKGDK
ncbi:MAG: 50S ribosomal protein L13 [Candidatus Woesearchaeota archaeon]